MWLNASKAEGDWTANLLYVCQTATMVLLDADATMLWVLIYHML